MFPINAETLCQLGSQVQTVHPGVLQMVLLDLPGLLFFSTYTLLVLFWAEIYHQARNLPTSSLRPMFVMFNALVYAVQVGNADLHSNAFIAEGQAM